MLSQAARFEVPDVGASVASTGWRARRLGICALTTRKVVTDWGLIAPLVSYIARQTRTQASVLLEGRGYFASGGRVHTLRPGDVVLSDQHRHDAEGYAGEPARFLIVDWDGDELAPRHQGPARVQRLGALERTCMERAFHALVQKPTGAALSVVATALDLLGLDGLAALAPEEPTPRALAPLYAELGRVRSGLTELPAASELADRLGVTERQVRRVFDQLDLELGVPTGGWRDFLSDVRLSLAHQLLAIDSLPAGRVAHLSGFRAATALCHAVSDRISTTPSDLARELRDRWELRPATLAAVRHLDGWRRASAEARPIKAIAEGRG